MVLERLTDHLVLVKLRTSTSGCTESLQWLCQCITWTFTLTLIIIENPRIQIVSSCFARLRSLIISLLTDAFICGNATLAGMSSTELGRLQSVVNATARLVCSARKFCTARRWFAVLRCLSGLSSGLPCSPLLPPCGRHQFAMVTTFCVNVVTWHSTNVSHHHRWFAVGAPRPTYRMIRHSHVTSLLPVFHQRWKSSPFRLRCLTTTWQGIHPVSC